jgi:hypothetical protein
VREHKGRDAPKLAPPASCIRGPIESDPSIEENDAQKTISGVTFAGLAPEFVGVDQINIVVPAVAGNALSLQIETGGIRTTEKIVIAVRNP